MPKVNVFITVDVEHSIGGAFESDEYKPVGNEKRIFGNIGDKSYGIPLIMDIADSYLIPVTFFVEVLNKYYFGEQETRTVCRYIIDRGHDVQLHLHPNFLNFQTSDPKKRYFSDLLSDRSRQEQTELIGEGKELLAKYGVSSPIAYRAGNFAADRTTLGALSENGFLIDSSYNRAYYRAARKINDHDLNDVTQIDGIWEFPITNFLEAVPFRRKRFKPLDINGVSYREILHLLKQAKAHGLQNITIVMHSFSFLRPSDVQYNKVAIQQHVIRKFQRLCSFLRDNIHDFNVRSFGSLDSSDLKRIRREPANHFPRMPSRLTVMRWMEKIRHEIL